MEEVGSTGQSRFSWSAWPGGALDRWLRILLLIIAATAVIIIAWTAIGPILHVAFLFFASLLFAYLIGPIVDRLARRMRRGAAIGLVFLVVLPLATLLLFLFLGPIISQLRALAAYLAGPSAAQSEALANFSA